MEILKLVVDYIKRHHLEIRELLPESGAFSLQAGAKRLQGYNLATFSAGKWEINIGHALTPETVYNVTADFSQGKVIWKGQVSESQVEESKYENVLPQKTS